MALLRSGTRVYGNATIDTSLAISGTTVTTSNSTGALTVAGGVGVAGDLYTSGNITIVGNITASSKVNLGSVSNVKITGGTSGYVLSTDGTGNLSWVSSSGASTSGDVYVDNFTAGGTSDTFTLSVTPGDIKYVSVNIDGVSQLRQSYTISGTTLTFGSTPEAGSKIEVTTIVPGSVSTSSTAATVTASSQPNITSVGTLTSLTVSGNIIPSANVTYSLGNATNRFKDIYLANNTIYLGDTAVSANSILPINLAIAPEVLTINVAAPFAGDDISWLWNWQTSTLPYARTTIVNSAQLSVPLYKQGTYQINNFANEQYGDMTQRHGAHLKWIDGAGLDNLVSWAVEAGNVSMSNVNIHSNIATNVQRINVSVPASITLPTLVAPNITNYMTVSCVNAGVYTFDGNGDGDNRTLGPLYRGGTYTFTLASSLSNDPFYFTTDNGTNWTSGGYYGEYTTGVTGSRNNGTSGKTTIKIVVDANAPDVLFYQSATNASKRGAIIIKNLAVETNINGNYVLYFQHTGEGHKTPVEIRPIPSLVDQMCVVYDATAGKFVPQDLATYVENTPSFKNKIREVAGTATLIAPNGVAVVPTVLVVEDTTYLPLINNKEGDIAFDSYYDTMYVWQGGAWRSTKATSIASLPGANITGAVSYATTANSVAGANVSGFVANANVANTAYAVSGSNVSGQVSNASVASTVYSSSQPNITSTGTLTGLTVSGNATITGNLTVTGTTITVNSNNVAYTDSIIELHTPADLSPLTTDDGKDIGIHIHYYKSSDKHAFFGFANDTRALEYYVDGTESAGTFSGTYGNFKGASYISTVTTGTAPFVVNSTTQVANLNAATAGLATYATTANAVAGANVSGFVANANVANTAYAVSGSNVSGAVAYATTANSVAVANVSGIGNIATVNKDGNASNILYGNGVFAGAPVTFGNSNVVTLLSSFGSNTITTTGNIKAGNANLGNLATANFFSGDGSLLTNVGTASSATTATSATTAGTVTTASQPNITSVGTLTSLVVGNSTANTTFGNGTITALGNISFTGSNVSLGAVGNLKITGGTANYYLKTDGTGNLSWSAPVSVQNYVKTYYWQGGLTENVGTLRFYIHTTATLNTITLNLVSAGLTQSTFVVKKNGTSVNTITVPAGNVAVSQTGLSIGLVANDYLTVDITQSSSASDAYINLIYTG